MMNKDDLLSALKSFEYQDPLLKRGIGEDWICIINPRIERPLLELASEIVHFFNAYAPNRLDVVMMRPVFVLSEAPIDVEYMALETARTKYPNNKDLQAYEQRRVEYKIMRMELEEELRRNPLLPLSSITKAGL